MLRAELGWNQQKSDELLLPVIQRVNKRGAAAAANKQSNLDAYLGGSIGSVGGSAVPRKRQAYTSKRLQKVVTDYRDEQRKRSRANAKRGASTLSDPDHSEDQFIEGLDANEDLPAEFGEDLDVDGSDDHGERDPRSGRVISRGIRKTSKSTMAAKTTMVTKRKAAGEKRKARKPSKNKTSPGPRPTKRKKRVNDSDDYDDDGEHADADEVAPAPARPRPRPVRKKANTNTDAGSKTTDQEHDG
jgi:DNA excision repair protein ERCC-5